MFAAAALTGLANLPGRYGRVMDSMTPEEMRQDNYDRMAEECFKFADSLLAAREGK
jgi:hypothetical protein